MSNVVKPYVKEKEKQKNSIINNFELIPKNVFMKRIRKCFSYKLFSTRNEKVTTKQGFGEKKKLY